MAIRAAPIPLGFGSDNFEGDAGTDTADYGTRTDNLSITMDDDLPNDGGNGGAEGDNVHSDVENVFGGSGNDAIVGNLAANFLAGGPGNDSLRGGGGLDKLIGGDGIDTLLGNAGVNLFFMSDGVKDKFDAPLDSTGRPLGEFVNGDPNVDVSTVNTNTALRVANRSVQAQLAVTRASGRAPCGRSRETDEFRYLTFMCTGRRPVSTIKCLSSQRPPILRAAIPQRRS